MPNKFVEFRRVSEYAASYPIGGFLGFPADDNLITYHRFQVGTKTHYKTIKLSTKKPFLVVKRENDRNVTVLLDGKLATVSADTIIAIKPSKVFDGLTFAYTGFAMPGRTTFLVEPYLISSYKTFIAAKGGKNVEKLSSKVDFLIVGPRNKISKKITLAEKKKIPILNLYNLRNLVLEKENG